MSIATTKFYTVFNGVRGWFLGSVIGFPASFPSVFPTVTGLWTLGNASAFRQTITANLTANHNVQLPDDDGLILVKGTANQVNLLTSLTWDLNNAGLTTFGLVNNGAGLRCNFSATGSVTAGTDVHGATMSSAGLVTFDTTVKFRAAGGVNSMTLDCTPTGARTATYQDGNGTVAYLVPLVDNATDLGTSVKRFSTLYLSTSIAATNDLAVQFNSAGTPVLTVSNGGAGDANLIVDKGLVKAFRTLRLSGGTLFDVILSGTPSANRTFTFPDSTGTVLSDVAAIPAITTVAGLPAAAGRTGMMRFCSDGRCITATDVVTGFFILQGAGTGTGCMAVSNGTVWQYPGTATTVLGG